MEPKYLLVFVASNISNIVLTNAFIYATKRTVYGDELVGKIRGFRNFLEVAEKPKLEMLVEQDPTYFYNILPFTYIFGLSDKWIKKFEGIALDVPTWYTPTTTMVFNTNRFNSFVEDTMSRATTSMTSSPNSSSSSGGSFSSGGGFSGGGFGGGGGGSW